MFFVKASPRLSGENPEPCVCGEWHGRPALCIVMDPEVGGPHRKEVHREQREGRSC